VQTDGCRTCSASPHDAPSESDVHARDDFLRNPCGIDLESRPRKRLEAPESGTSTVRTAQTS
jgi:hypothetical protein